MLNERQTYLLRLLVREYIVFGKPVGSQTLVARHELGISPATVRNDFVFLEEEGYITHPHTSAGRIPTLLGYKYYVEHLDEEVQKVKNFESRVRAAVRKDEQHLTRTLAELTGQSVVWVNGTGRVFYSGLSKMLSNPEFENEDLRLEVGSIFDRMEEVLKKIDVPNNDAIAYAIGDNDVLPSSQCSMVSTHMREGKKFPMVMVIGPLRMDYDAAVSLLTLVRKLYDE